MNRLHKASQQLTANLLRLIMLTQVQLKQNKEKVFTVLKTSIRRNRVMSQHRLHPKVLEIRLKIFQNKHLKDKIRCRDSKYAYLNLSQIKLRMEQIKVLKERSYHHRRDRD